VERGASTLFDPKPGTRRSIGWRMALFGGPPNGRRAGLRLDVLVQRRQLLRGLKNRAVSYLEGRFLPDLTYSFFLANFSRVHAGVSCLWTTCQRKASRKNQAPQDKAGAGGRWGPSVSSG